MSQNRIAKLWLSFLAFGVVLAGAYFVVVMSGPWSMMHCFEGRFAQLPATDGPLIAAIEDAERVIEGSVSVKRLEEPGAIRVCFGTGGNLWNRPPLPDLAALCANLGYDGPNGEFREVRSH